MFKINVNAVAFGFIETRLTQSKEQGGEIEREGEKIELGIPARVAVGYLPATGAAPDQSAWQALDAGPIAALRAEEARGAAVVLTLCGDRAARRFVPQRRGAGTFLRGLLRRPQAATVLRDL